MVEIALGVLALFTLSAFIALAVKLSAVSRSLQAMPEHQARLMEEKHRLMIADLHDGLAKQADRLGAALTESSERLRARVDHELNQTREALQVLQLSQNHSLAQNRETMIKQLSDLTLALQEKLADQGRAEQELIQTTLRNTTELLIASVENLTKTFDTRLEQISGRVSERLDEGFKKTNETFTNVMTRLATIDEAQKKIDSLTTNVVSLQELLGDKRSRGAFGEVQLEALVRNILPPAAYEFQYTLSSNARADCVLRLPEPTGMVAVDSKFPLENYHRMFAPGVTEAERAQAQKQFKADIRKHVEDISQKYIIPGETSDGAVMFVPAEAVFAEIHAYHPEIVDYAMQRRVWIVSPTTIMAVLNTARAVIKDVETRKQVHIIKDELSKLGREFARFDERMKKLADHIRQAHEDAERVHVTSQKISQRFAQIESVELEHPREARVQLLDVTDADEVGKPDVPDSAGNA